MASYNTVLHKNDRAVMAYLIAQGVGTKDNILAAKSSRGKAMPNVIIWSREAAEDGGGSGTYRVQVSVMVKNTVATEAAVTAQNTLLGKAADALRRSVDGGDQLGEAITTAARELAAMYPGQFADLADYTCQNVEDAGIEQGFEEDSDIWVDTINFEMIVAPSNVS